jgi:hypothetical protein
MKRETLSSISVWAGEDVNSVWQRAVSHRSFLAMAADAAERQVQKV